LFLCGKLALLNVIAKIKYGGAQKPEGRFLKTGFLRKTFEKILKKRFLNPLYGGKYRPPPLNLFRPLEGVINPLTPPPTSIVSRLIKVQDLLYNI